MSTSPAPKFSVGIDADPMMVEKTLDKTLDEIIQDRRKETKGERMIVSKFSSRVCEYFFAHPLPAPAQFGTLIL